MMGVWEDNRIGGHRRWRACDGWDLMPQVPDALRKCVCFVMGRLGGNWYHAGTGFFVSVPASGSDVAHVYAATASHVLHPETATPGGQAWEAVALRINTHDGGIDQIETPLSDWQIHERSDTAVLAVVPPQQRFDYLHYPIAASATAEFRAREYVTAGEDLIISGLLVHHPGGTRNVPIIRVGNVASFPGDPIPIGDYDEQVILADVPSIGGLSGSPAFIHFGDLRRNAKGELGLLRWQDSKAAGSNYLLGLVHGYFEEYETGANREQEAVNVGISVIIPVERIIELINGPVLMADREERETEMRKQRSPRPAAATVKGSGQQQFTRFEDLTRKLLTVPKAELDAIREQERHGTGEA